MTVKLLEATQKKWGLASPQDVASLISFCGVPQGSSGATHQSSSTSYITRSMEEKIQNQELLDPQKLEAAVLKFYAAVIGDLGAQHRIKIEENLIEIKVIKKMPQICLSDFLKDDQQINTLVHELVHLTFQNILEDRLDFLKFDSYRAFKKQTIQQRGNELDAYLFELSYVLKTHGAPNFDHPQEPISSLYELTKRVGPLTLTHSDAVEIVATQVPDSIESGPGLDVYQQYLRTSTRMNLLQDLVTLRGQEISSYRKAGDTAIAKIAADSLENIQVDLKTTAEAKRKLYAAATEINRP